MIWFGVCRYVLNIWDVGGQKTIRSYWRNYFEQTDGLVWVVDSSDLRRLDDCKFELDNLLKEEVCFSLGGMILKLCKFLLTAGGVCCLLFSGDIYTTFSD